MSTAGVALALPAPSVARPGFGGALRSEYLKLTRQRAAWLLLGAFPIAYVAAALVIGLNDPGAHGRISRQPPINSIQVMFGGTFQVASGIVLLLLSARLMGMEFTSGTVRVLFGRGQSRLHLYLAKITILGAFGLAAFAIYALATALFTAVLIWHLAGDLSPLRHVPSVAWADTAIAGAVLLISMAVCILLGSAAAVLGRSLAFAASVAMGFFPVDNFGVVVLGLLSRATQNSGWGKPSAYLLGPSLNVLAKALQTDHANGVALAPPLVPVDGTHALVVVGVWALAFLLGAMILIRARDVLE
ncbi:MAG: ABC transporter permease [Candidatus Dormibacteraeota bacterium]|nr:ABC transporter permease [Candidatus Dormibacteraeota bacterium]